MVLPFHIFKGFFFKVVMVKESMMWPLEWVDSQYRKKQNIADEKVKELRG